MFSSVGVSDSGVMGGFQGCAFAGYIGYQGDGVGPVRAMRAVCARDSFVRFWVAWVGNEDGDGVLECFQVFVFQMVVPWAVFIGGLWLSILGTKVRG